MIELFTIGVRLSALLRLPSKYFYHDLLFLVDLRCHGSEQVLLNVRNNLFLCNEGFLKGCNKSRYVQCEEEKMQKCSVWVPTRVNDHRDRHSINVFMTGVPRQSCVIDEIALRLREVPKLYNLCGRDFMYIFRYIFKLF